MAKTFEHILVPYNGTTGSEKAFRKAISLASSKNFESYKPKKLKILPNQLASLE